MAVEVVKCPCGKQKLGVQAYVQIGSRIVCAHRDCNQMLRVTQRNPLRLEIVARDEQRTSDSSPESYG
jgi:hypothetical protein